MTDRLTKRQEEVIRYIVQFTFVHLYQPSMREIGEALDMSSTNAIKCHLDALRRKGYIKFNDFNARSSSRSLYLTDKALAMLDVTDPSIRIVPVKKGDA